MKLILAPMEGLTDPIMRDVLTSVGSFDWCVTEFIRVTNSVLPDHVYHSYCPELLNGGKTAAGTPVHVQFLGNDPEMLAANAIRAVELGAPVIDMNFGCPAKTVNRHRGGSVLLDEPEVVYELVKAVRDAIPADIPVSAKMRLGYMDRNFTMENAHAIEDAGASWVTVHARTKADGYTPPAFWDVLQPIKETLKINVIANGEIWTNADAKQCQLESGCEDLMIGRGAVTTPDLTQCIRQNTDQALLTWDELLSLQLRFLSGPYKKEINMVGRYKQWIGMMSKHYPEAKLLWNEVKRAKKIDELIEKLKA